MTISKQHKQYHDRYFYNTQEYYYDDYGMEDEYGGEGEDYNEENDEADEERRNRVGIYENLKFAEDEKELWDINDDDYGEEYYDEEEWSVPNYII